MNTRNGIQKQTAESYTVVDYATCVDYCLSQYRGTSDWFTMVYTAFLTQYDVGSGVVHKYMYRNEPISKAEFRVGYLAYIESEEIEENVEYGYIALRMCRGLPRRVEERIKEVAYRLREVDVWRLLFMLFGGEEDVWRRNMGLHIDEYFRRRGYAIELRQV
jgi:hypothetical protein